MGLQGVERRRKVLSEPPLAVGPVGLPGQPRVGPGEGQVPALFGRPSRRRSSFPASSGSTRAVSYVGTSNVDRFSKIQFGFFGGTSLRGFRSGSLRAEEAVDAKVAYGIVVGKLFRLQALYDHAIVKDAGERPRLGELRRRRDLGPVPRPLVDPRPARGRAPGRRPEPRPEGLRRLPRLPEELLRPDRRIRPR